jgi:two-component system KDP operon response regulator KdpE
VSTTKVVLVDDEPNLVKIVGQNLRARGYEVLEASSGPDAIALVKQHRPDLIILDVRMPGMDGFEVCVAVRPLSVAPIIMLTASGDEADNIRALDLGADDYLTKPYGIGELMARVRAVMRRAERGTQPHTQHDAVETADFRIDLEHRRVTRSGLPVKLTSTEYSLLEAILARPDVALTDSHLSMHVWGPDYRDEPKYLRESIVRLRHMLEPDPDTPRYLLTEPEIGYRFTSIPA